MALVLHGYWRSGTSHRTRIALNLKGAAYSYRPVNLLQGEQSGEAYRRLNPQGLVPALEVDGAVLTQSPAILEWLEETHPQPPLLPSDPVGRAHVRAMAALVGCDVHPLNNLRVLKAVRKLADGEAAPVDDWVKGWITQGFAALEELISTHGAGFCFGDAPTLADCYLIPQVYSARRFKVPLDAFPRIVAVDERAARLDAFDRAHPDRQPDARAA
jgi:maleylpyruvate isomerase